MLLYSSTQEIKLQQPKKNKLDAFYTKLCDVLPDDEPTRFETLGVSLF